MNEKTEEQNILALPAAYVHDLTRTRKMLSALLDLLEEEIASCGAKNTDEKNTVSPRYEAVWGAKESVLSALGKLAQLQIRLLPLEQECSPDTETGGIGAPALGEVLREECMEALERFFHKRREAGLPLSPEE